MKQQHNILWLQRQVDHTEEDVSDVATFARMADVKAGTCPDAAVTMFQHIIRCCVRRVPKRRPCISEVGVSKYLAPLMVLNTITSV